MGGGGTRNAEGCEAPPVLAKTVNWWEACLPREDGGGRRVQVVSDPAADPVPERVHALEGVVVGDQEIGPVCQDGEEAAHGDAVGQVRAGAASWGGEPFYENKGTLRQGEAIIEVMGGVEGGGEPIP